MKQSQRDILGCPAVGEGVERQVDPAATPCELGQHSKSPGQESLLCLQKQLQQHTGANPPMHKQGPQGMQINEASAKLSKKLHAHRGKLLQATTDFSLASGSAAHYPQAGQQARRCSNDILWFGSTLVTLRL